MCLGIPYEVLDVVDRDTCQVRVGTGAQQCFTGLVDPVAPGDWVLVHAGFALRRIEPEDARANLDLIRRALAAPATATRARSGRGAAPEDEP